jgi:hypothetical protein
MGVSRPRAPLGARYMHLHLSLDTCICRWIHAWVPRVEAGMYYEVRSCRKHPMLSSLTFRPACRPRGSYVPWARCRCLCTCVHMLVHMLVLWSWLKRQAGRCRGSNVCR